MPAQAARAQCGNVARSGQQSLCSPERLNHLLAALQYSQTPALHENGHGSEERAVGANLMGVAALVGEFLYNAGPS